MIKSLKWRLVMMYVLLVIIIMIVSGTLIVTMLNNNAYKKIDDELKAAVQYIKELQVNEENIKSYISDYAELFKDKRVYLLNTRGNIIYSPLGVSDEVFNTSSVMAAAYDEPTKRFETVRLPNINGHLVEYRGYAEPTFQKDAVIYVLASTEQLKNNMMDTVAIIILAILLAIVCTIVLGFAFSNFLTKPITALTKKARDMSRGHLEDPIEVLSNDEIGQLTENFNMMAKELKSTLSEISGEKNKLETVLTHMTDGILAFDFNGQLIHNNPAAFELLNKEKAYTYNDIFNTLLESNYKELLELTKRDIVQRIIPLRDKYVNVCFAIYLNKNKNLMGMICVIQDITEHKKLEEMQKEFVANVSHELRTPLTTIKSYAETLLDGAVEDKDTAKAFLQVINNEGDRMTALVQDLLELSKLDNKQTKFKMQEINLNCLLEDIIEKYKIHAAKKNQSMNYQAPVAVYKISADVNRVEQVIKNIISNAVKYSNEKAMIEVNLNEGHSHVIISIKDTGMGIPPEDLSRIFERFYRVDKARSRAMGGTGLGLAIAQEIMEYHGGKIEVESQFGEGSCFKLYFPKTN